MVIQSRVGTEIVIIINILGTFLKLDHSPSSLVYINTLHFTEASDRAGSPTPRGPGPGGRLVCFMILTTEQSTREPEVTEGWKGSVA